MTDQEYWTLVRTLPVYVKPEAASAGRQVVVVDWSEHMTGKKQPGYEWVLGFNPIDQKWVDTEAQYQPLPAWASQGGAPDTPGVVDRLTWLEAEVDAIKKKLGL